MDDRYKISFKQTKYHFQGFNPEWTALLTSVSIATTACYGSSQEAGLAYPFLNKIENGWNRVGFVFFLGAFCIFLPAFLCVFYSLERCHIFPDTFLQPFFLSISDSVMKKQLLIFPSEPPAAVAAFAVNEAALTDAAAVAVNDSVMNQQLMKQQQQQQLQKTYVNYFVFVKSLLDNISTPFSSNLHTKVF